MSKVIYVSLLEVNKRNSVYSSKRYLNCSYIFIFGLFGFLKFRFKKPNLVKVRFNKIKIYGPNISQYYTNIQILYNLFFSVNVGYKVFLELRGVGFKYKIKKNILYLVLGFSHLNQYKIPKSIYLFLLNVRLLRLMSCNLNLLNNFIYLIKNLKKLDVYKGKGIFFKGEFLLLKEGKKSSTF